MNSFFANIYEWLYYEPDFSQAIYSSGLYTLLGLDTLVSAIVMVFLYYKFIDRPRFANILSWTIFGGISGLLSSIITYIITTLSLAQNYDFGGEYFIISLYSALLSVICYVVLSLIIKNISINCKNIPF